MTMEERPREPRHQFRGYPKGWFVIAFSDELATSGVVMLEYFGKKLVLYRGESGVCCRQ